jgi:hypothetical protein
MFAVLYVTYLWPQAMGLRTGIGIQVLVHLMAGHVPSSKDMLLLGWLGTEV